MPNFKKPRGGFSKKFAAKRADSPFEAADAALMAAVGDNEVDSKDFSKGMSEAYGKSERAAQVTQNLIKGGKELVKKFF